MNNERRITIIGAGLGGSLMACYLAKAGFEVDIYERMEDPRVHGFTGGRSINLALSERGLHALREVGLADEVLKHVIPMPGRMIHSPDGSLHFQAYSKNPGDRINSVSRGKLNLILLEAAAAHPKIRFHFGHRCTAIHFMLEGVKLEFERGDARERVQTHADRVIGADGAYSAVRLHMMLNMDRFEYRQGFLQHGYKELTIPPDSNGEFAMRPNALHIWPRGSSMMIALPNADCSFTCTCFWPFGGFEALRTDEQIRAYFNEHFPDAVPLMPTLIEDFKRNPTSSLVTVSCHPWHYQNKAILLGDAAHAIVPFYGQGMNAAFEDCSALMNCIHRFAPDWFKVFTEYQTHRKPNADAIAEMALDNFIEMRDKTASPLFRGKKKLEHALHTLFPNWFMPLYNMISFTTIPYAEARRRARSQSRALKIIAFSAALVIIGCTAILVLSR